MKKTTAIKFFWNGLKVNGEKKLIKCFYGLDNRHDGRECVTIYARGYSDKLPGDMFPVENETDLYTDYHDTDRAEVFPGHPLYSYARAAAIKAELRNEKRYRAETCALIRQEHLKRLWKYKQELETLPAGQPTAADVEAVHTLNLAAETARIAAEKEQEQKKREKAHSDLLEACTAAGRVVSVSLAPWLEKAVEARQKAAEERARDTMDMVEMLTDDQLAAAVLRSPKKQPDIARFFLQQLANRDEEKALSVFRAWRSGAGLEFLDEI